MTSALVSLQIDHLRGSLTSFTLPFERDKCLTIIYGENGSGKSSICDALEFLGKGEIGSLNDRGLGRTTKYWSAHGKTSADVSVTLKTAHGSCRGSMARNGSVVLDPPQNRPHVEVFRRAQIRSLVEAAPADRYKAVQRFVDVTHIEQSEDALRRLIKELKSIQEIAVAEIGQNEQSLLQFWQQAGSPGTSWRTWAEAEANRDSSALRNQIHAIQELIGTLEDLERSSARIDAAQAELDRARGSATLAQEEADAVANRVAHDAQETVAVLNAAQAYLARHGPISACPLCESEERVADLADRISERIRNLDAVRASAAEAARLANAATVAERQHAASIGEGQAAAKAFRAASRASDLPSELELPHLPIPDDTALVPVWLAATVDRRDGWQRAVATRFDKQQFSGVLKTAVATWREHRAEQIELARLIPRLERALAVAEAERRAFSDTILAEIANDVGRLYETVHPGEGLNKISLLLDTKKRASLDLQTSFRGATLPPPAYFSDSHLDTLGICIFIALAKLEDPAQTILVLDDVVASVDEPHVDRLIEMIYQEASHFQHCLLTTHYRPWKEKYRWGLLKSGQCQFVELGRWCATNGLSLAASGSSDIVRMRALMAETPPDLQLVCAKAGVVLESLLDFLTQLYECKAPRRAGGRYTLGDLLPAIDGKLRQALRVEVQFTDVRSGTASYQVSQLSPLLDQLTTIMHARNIFGAHFNQLSFDLLATDALDFAEAVEELAALLVDDDRGWPKSAKSGSYWSTPGETRRLHPLKRPS